MGTKAWDRKSQPTRLRLGDTFARKTVFFTAERLVTCERKVGSTFGFDIRFQHRKRFKNILVRKVADKKK